MRSLLPILLLPLTVSAQQPTVAGTAVAVGAERLPVLDDDGRAIPELLIRSMMKSPENRRFYLFGSVLGALVFALATQTEGRDCSIYEPCSPREKWRKKWGPWYGLAVGTMVGLSLPAGVDREEAVKRIRAERRRAIYVPTP